MEAKKAHAYNIGVGVNKGAFTPTKLNIDQQQLPEYSKQSTILPPLLCYQTLCFLEFKRLEKKKK